MARPRKYSNEAMIQALIETKGMVYLAAEKLGCEADTIYNRAKVEPKVAKKLKHESGKVNDTAELKLFTAIMNGEAWAIMFRLRTVGKDRGYIDRTEHLHGGDPNNPTPIKNEHTVINRIAGLTDAFTLAAHREETGDSPGDGIREPVDSRFHQNGTNGQAS